MRCKTVGIFILLLAFPVICAAQGATIIGRVSSRTGAETLANQRVLLREYPKFQGKVGRIVRTSIVGSDQTFHFLGVPPFPGYLIEIERANGFNVSGAIDDIRSGETINLRGEFGWPCGGVVNWIQNRQDTGIVFRDPPRRRHNWIFICE